MARTVIRAEPGYRIATFDETNGDSFYYETVVAWLIDPREADDACCCAITPSGIYTPETDLIWMLVHPDDVHELVGDTRYADAQQALDDLNAKHEEKQEAERDNAAADASERGAAG